MNNLIYYTRYYSTKGNKKIKPLTSEDLINALKSKYKEVTFVSEPQFNNACYMPIQMWDMVQAYKGEPEGREELQKLALSWGLSKNFFLEKLGKYTVVYGRKFFDPATIAHELGHHMIHTKGGIYNAALVKGYGLTAVGNSWLSRLLQLGLTIGFGKKMLLLTTAIRLGLNLPQVIHEASASRRGIGELKRLGASKKQLRAYKRDLGLAWSTYALADLILPISLGVLGEAGHVSWFGSFKNKMRKIGVSVFKKRTPGDKKKKEIPKKRYNLNKLMKRYVRKRGI